MNTENVSNEEKGNGVLADVISRFLVVYDKRDETFGYMETAWTDEELYFRWDVISEHKTKDEARVACDSKNGL